MKASAAPKMQDIADRAGVTRSAVSLALRNHPSIPAKTRALIHQIAAELGYRPNPLVSALMSHLRATQPPKRTTPIAYLTAHTHREGWRINYPYFEGATQRAAEHGFRLDLVWGHEPGMTARRLTAILRARNIRGVLLHPLPVSRGHLSLDWSQFAVATMGYSVWRPVFHRAVADLFQITTVALRRIERLGYRRIGLMMEHRLDERTNHQYSAAFLDWQRTVPVRQRVPLTVLPKWDEPMFRKWFRRHTPEAIVCPDPKPIRWIEAANLRVPDDVGFVNLCESPMHTGLAAMRHHPRLVGAAAVDLVVAQLQRNELGIPAHPKIVLIEGEWVDGPTVRRWP